ncbi:hypothetical protein BRADI_2g25386v3 [Brachypodium distachyon]|uniref:Uncharacterized protein n=1 Tax=Brachypodium distachyon TaxID=15368 RepID=A0A2K2DAG8_BRADI|nr:hypothetical protein BRADI_2g25386v3 [Brachypodium distachyon]
MLSRPGRGGHERANSPQRRCVIRSPGKQQATRGMSHVLRLPFSPAWKHLCLTAKRTARAGRAPIHPSRYAWPRAHERTGPDSDPPAAAASSTTTTGDRMDGAHKQSHPFSGLDWTGADPVAVCFGVFISISRRGRCCCTAPCVPCVAVTAQFPPVLCVRLLGFSTREDRLHWSVGSSARGDGDHWINIQSPLTPISPITHACTVRECTCLSVFFS